MWQFWNRILSFNEINITFLFLFPEAHYELFDSDMVLSEDEIVHIITDEDFHGTESGHTFGLSKFKRSKWPGGIVPYTLHSSASRDHSPSKFLFRRHTDFNKLKPSLACKIFDSMIAPISTYTGRKNRFEHLYN